MRILTHAEMHLADADHSLAEVIQDPCRDDRDHLAALATATALTAIATHLIGGA